MRFCNHPKPDGEARCSTCKRVENICRKHQREQRRLNEGKRLLSLGRAIAAGNA